MKHYFIICVSGNGETRKEAWEKEALPFLEEQGRGVDECRFGMLFETVPLAVKLLEKSNPTTQQEKDHLNSVLTDLKELIVEDE